MKRMLSLLLIFCLLAPACLAEPEDFSALSFEQLTSLNREVSLAIFETHAFQQAIVPDGVYEIGKDIPEGEWVVSA